MGMPGATMNRVVIHDMNPSIAEQLGWEHED